MGKWRLVVWVALVGATLWFLWAVRSVLLPFALAWIIAILLDPMVRRLRLRGVSRGASVAVITAGFLLLTTGIVIWAVPKVTDQLADVRVAVDRLTEAVAQEDAGASFFTSWNPAVRAAPSGPFALVDRLLEDFSPTLERFNLPNTRREIADQYLAPHEEQIASGVQNFFNGLLGIIGNAASQVFLLAFTPIFAILMLLEMERFKRTSASWIPPAIRKDTVSLLREIGDVFTNYLRGVTISVTLFTSLMAVVLLALGAPYSILLAIIAGVLSLIPYLGAFVTTAVIVLVVGLSGVTGTWFTDFGSSWTFALVTVGVTFVVGLLYDNLVHPRIVGSSVGLPPLLSMFVIFSGGALFGVLGAIVAFPVAGAVKVVLTRLLRLTSGVSVEGVRLPAVPLRHRET